MPSLRVLIIAEAANPEWTSVPLVGWNLSRALAKHVNVHLVTQIRNRGSIIRSGLVEGRDFTAIDNERFAYPLYWLSEKLRGGPGKGWTTRMAFSSLSYYSFELALWRQFKTRLIAGEFDLVHRITPLSPTSQSILARRLAKLKIPFVIGPLNGGVPWPKHFRERQYAEHEWLSHFRAIYKLMPAYRATRQYSSAIIVGSKHTRQDMPRWAEKKCVYIPENGVDLDLIKSPRERVAALPVRAAFVGRLVPYKGVDILLEATAGFIRTGQLELHIIGDGPQREFLTLLGRQLGISDRIRFYGWLPQVEVMEKLRTCDFMALPSVREFGGGVIVEAMALGVTPVVADYAGPSELVDENTGIRVPFHDKASLVNGMRLAVENIIRGPQILDVLGAAARRKASETLTWAAKANQINAIYAAVLAGADDLTVLDVR